MIESDGKTSQLRPRAEPIQARALQARRRVLEAAHGLLKARGVQHLTTIAIAEASGVSIGALYRFFPNKESIICQLYEDKLAQIRQRGLAARPAGPEVQDWRDFFRAYIAAMKAAERAVDLDFSLVEAIWTIPELFEIDQRHGLLVAEQMAADMRRFGSTWSDAALFDLGVTLYALDAAVWMYWRYSGGYPDLAVSRMTEASLALLAPAMEGAPEPDHPPIDRARLLGSRGGG